MKGKAVHPAVTIIAIVLVCGAIWFVFTSVFTGQEKGFSSIPSSGSAMPKKGK